MPTYSALTTLPGEDAARALANELVKAGKTPVFSGEAPKDILTGQDRTASAQKAEGITSDKLDGEEIKKLLGLIQSVAEFQRRELTNETLHMISTTQRKKLQFAWAGSLERNGGHYFRIQGVDFIIEYANTQNDANHAHLVWRDLKNDFARDSLKKHYEEGH